MVIDFDTYRLCSFDPASRFDQDQGLATFCGQLVPEEGIDQILQVIYPNQLTLARPKVTALFLLSTVRWTSLPTRRQTLVGA